MFLGVLAPIGEELLFRRVVAVVVGLIAGELRRRSDSVLPGVAAHTVFNLLSNGLAFVVVPVLAT